MDLLNLIVAKVSNPFPSTRTVFMYSSINTLHEIIIEVDKLQVVLVNRVTVNTCTHVV